MAEAKAPARRPGCRALCALPAVCRRGDAVAVVVVGRDNAMSATVLVCQRGCQKGTAPVWGDRGRWGLGIPGGRYSAI
jgi:hypothetical protein